MDTVEAMAEALIKSNVDLNDSRAVLRVLEDEGFTANVIGALYWDAISEARTLDRS